MHPQPLVAQRSINAPKLSGIQVSTEGAEGLHEDMFGPGTGGHGAVEDVPGLGAEFPTCVAEADVRDPETRVMV